MNRFGVALIVFSVVLGSIVYAADIGVGLRYWGFLHRIPLGDKMGHLGLMFTFSLLANLAFSVRGVRGSRQLLLGTLIVTLLVVGEEISQCWIPGRSFDLLDLAADFMGIACGDLLSRILWLRRQPAGPGLATVSGPVPSRIPASSGNEGQSAGD